MKTFIFIHFEPEDRRIAIRGLERMINKFLIENEKKLNNDFQLYKLANDFNKKQTSVVCWLNQQIHKI